MRHRRGGARTLVSAAALASVLLSGAGLPSAASVTGSAAGTIFGWASAARHQAVAENPCVSTDNGDPVINGVSVSPGSVDVRDSAAVVTVRADAGDSGGPGPATGIASLVGQLGDRLLTFAAAPDGSWIAQVTLPRGAKAGTYSVSELRMADSAGNEKFYLDDDLTRLGLTAAVEVTSPQPDVTAPHLLDLQVSHRTVDVRHQSRLVHVTARTVDDISGVYRIDVTAMARGTFLLSRARLRLVEGDDGGRRLGR